MHLSVERLGSYPQTQHDSLDPISADRACVTKQCKGTYKQFVVFQSSFQHCFHLKFHLSTLAGTSALRGWTKLGLGDRPTPGGAYSKVHHAWGSANLYVKWFLPLASTQ